MGEKMLLTKAQAQAIKEAHGYTDIMEGLGDAWVEASLVSIK
jgi:hypothetical protein